MATDMNEVSGRLRAPWGPPTAPYAPGRAPPPPQVTQVPPPYQLGCGCCTQQVYPTQVTTTRYANDPNWETHAYPGDEPDPPPDKAFYDSGYERDPMGPPYVQEDPGKEPKDEADDAFTRACHQALRNLTQPRRDPRGIAGWEPPPSGQGPPGEESYWGEDLD